MAARAQTPLQDGYNSVPAPNASLMSKGYGLGSSTGASDFASMAGKPMDSSPLGQSAPRTTSAFSYRPDDDLDTDDRGSTVQHLEGAGLHRTASGASAKGVLSKTNTLKKQKSLNRKSGLKKSGSRKSLHAGSIKGVSIDDKRGQDEYNSVFYTPVPTTGTPTEILANRFQAWRKLLKDLITYFREVQASYESRSKALLKVSNVVNNTNTPSVFMTEGGLNDANRILRDYHKQAVAEANKARDIENDVIGQLNGLRADLGQKIKEIKSLSGDFKNSVEKEKDHTRKEVSVLQEALSVVDMDPKAVAGKDDPYIIKLHVDRQVERQIDEENYLHRAYLNLEGSGRELESIVVGEIQKAYNALASILKREADEAYSAIDQLRSGPIILPKDYEWTQFVAHDPHFVSPDTPLRRVEEIEYPGKHHPAAAEVRAGMLERKSKYLKSYTPGWYVLSPTHLHEFKSADRIYTQPPVMSLLLADQKLGAHSQPGSSSHKFMLKGRQTGSMHRGHSWVFRAETYDTMLAWYDDIRNLTEKTGEERNAFVRKHARSMSGSSMKAGSISGDSGMEEDEADEVPYSANASLTNQPVVSDQAPARPQPGGRFPSDIQVSRHLQAPLSPSSGSSMADQDLSTAAGGLQHDDAMYDKVEYGRDPATAQHHQVQQTTQTYPTAVAFQQQQPQTGANQVPAAQPLPPQDVSGAQPDPRRPDSNYGSWIGPAAGGAALGASAVGAEEYWRNKRQQAEQNQDLSDQADTEKSVVVSQQQQQQMPTRTIVPSDTNRTISNASQSVMTESTAPTSISGFGDVPVALASIPTPAKPAAPLSKDIFPKEIHTAYDTNPDGSVNAHPTGEIFPRVLRHDTDTSISALHIPGEFPRAGTL